MMNYSPSKKKAALAVSLALSVGMVTTVATAQTDTNPNKVGYLIDQRNEVAKSNFGLCWRTSAWTPAMAIAECDPDLVPKATPVAAKAAEPVRPVAAPSPPPPRPMAQRVTLEADTLFDFNKANLRPAGQAALDDFIAKSAEIRPEIITAVGHADRFGTDAYNQKLSEQRAATVRAYLMGKGIPENRIQTEGKGESQPITKTGDCLGAKSAKVIACLQPDRRVEIEVIGNSIVK